MSIVKFFHSVQGNLLVHKSEVQHDICWTNVQCRNQWHPAKWSLRWLHTSETTAIPQGKGIPRASILALTRSREYRAQQSRILRRWGLWVFKSGNKEKPTTTTCVAYVPSTKEKAESMPRRKRSKKRRRTQWMPPSSCNRTTGHVPKRKEIKALAVREKEQHCLNNLHRKARWRTFSYRRLERNLRSPIRQQGPPPDTISAQGLRRLRILRWYWKASLRTQPRASWRRLARPVDNRIRTLQKRKSKWVNIKASKDAKAKSSSVPLTRHDT